MQKGVFTFFFLISGVALFSQVGTTQTAPFGIKFDGFVREDVVFDSRQVEQLREGMFLFYPLNSNLDINGKDINARSSFNLFAIASRLSGKITGPNAFGARTSGLLEGEFFGAANANINTFRLRHAFVKLNWSKTELLVGQTWHSLFTEECFPGTLNFNTGTPFQPFNRAPQIRIKHSFDDRIKVTLAVLTQRDFTSTGPAGISYQYMSNAAIPEITLGVSYAKPKTDSTSLFGFGIVGEYKQLLPRLVTDSNVRATQKIESLAAAAYFQFENKRFGVKIKAVYGQNLYDQLMLGGYAVRYDSLLATDGDCAYTNIVAGAAWADAFVNIGKINIAIFGGYTKNFGSFNNVSDWNNSKSYYSRGYNIDYVYRVAPRISCTIGSLKLGVEFDYTVAAYGSKLNSLGEVEQPTKTNTATISEVENTRILGLIQYNF